jgi:hypothetical protein
LLAKPNRKKTVLSAKTQSGGDFVSHFAKNENCVADFIFI